MKNWDLLIMEISIINLNGVYGDKLMLVNI